MSLVLYLVEALQLFAQLGHTCALAACAMGRDGDGEEEGKGEGEGGGG